MCNDIVQRFCTPPSLPLADFDAKVLAGWTERQIPFESAPLTAYCTGEGENVLLVHGWGSRASHLALAGRFLAMGGFHVVAPDMPAHSSRGTPAKPTSNMFEYCRAVAAAARSLQPLHAIMGHSFGAMCAAFVAAGNPDFAEHRVFPSRLVLISTPPTLGSVLESYCRRDGSGAAGFPILKAALEEAFHFSIDDYTVEHALHGVSVGTLFIHDENDEEFPLESIRAVHETSPRTRLFVTRACGHQKILGNRAMIGRVRTFLQKGE